MFRLPRLVSCTTLLMLTAPLAQAATTLPFPAGWYVEDGESCAEGNDAALLQLHAAGFNNRYGMCELQAVTPTEDNAYSYASTCEDPEQRVEILNEGIVRALSETSFQIYDGVMDLTYKLCPAGELPPPYGD